ncbi:MAG: hypothetical protein R3304_01855 [Longimicrobiales bacterium]|nr:hypothetical protein [Longimicrobiales bacterium]
MSGERRYDDAEVQEIFLRASEARERDRLEGSGDADGMTLAELKEIGRQVGIPEERIGRAAASLQTLDGARMLKRFGAPVGVDRRATLGRRLTDTEWERLVALLRRTFRAKGDVEVVGRLRQWSNGNLHVSVEPGPDGDLLHLQTTKGSLRPTLTMSVSFILVAAVLAVTAVVTGGSVDVGSVGILALIGAGAGGASLAGLPSWARRRARQMDGVAGTVQEWTGLPEPESPAPGEG